MDILVRMLISLINSLIMMMAIAMILIFGLCFYAVYESSENNWRNENDIRFNIEDGVSADGKMQSDETVADTDDVIARFIESCFEAE